MKTIIAGTDFTPSSVNACRYAAFLAKKLGCKLTLVNLFEAPIIHSNVGLYGISYTNQKKESLTKTTGLKQKLLDLVPGINIDYFVSNGSLKEEIENFTSHHQVLAVVMGLDSKSGISKLIYGSRGVNMAGRIDAPVIIVPKSYTQFTLSHVLLAVDNNEKLHKISLKPVEKFVKLAGASLDLLHVRTDDEIFHAALNSIKLLGKKMPVQVINEKDTESGIKKYSRQKKTDLITIISKKHSVFYNFFVERNTSRIAYSAKIPVMAIHEQ